MSLDELIVNKIDNCVLKSRMIVCCCRVHNVTNLQTKDCQFFFSSIPAALWEATHLRCHLKRGKREKVVSCVFYLCTPLTWKKVAGAMPVRLQQ